MEISAEMLVEQTYNFYGIKSSHAMAREFMALATGAVTPGSFFEWVSRQLSSRDY